MHDVQWHPSGDYFVTVAGFMPAKTTLFTDACKPHFDLGSGPHNIARWNPQARPALCHSLAVDENTLPFQPVFA